MLNALLQLQLQQQRQERRAAAWLRLTFYSLAHFVRSMHVRDGVADLLQP